MFIIYSLISKVALLPLCLFFYAFVPVPVGNAETIDGIAAIVNDEIITHSELEERLRPYLSYIGDNLETEEREKRRAMLRKEILDELINEKLMLMEAKRIGIAITDGQIESELSNLKKKLNPAANFESLLAQEKLTREEFREKLREQLLLRKVVEIQLRGKVNIPSEEEARQFFEKNSESFREPESIAVSEIVVKVEGEAKWLEAAKKIEDIHERLLKGEDFAALAKQYSYAPSSSRGGSLGFINLGELLPEFENAISTLKVGETSSIIKTKTGFHIIRLESRKKAYQKQFANVRKKIESQLYRLRMEQALREWVKELQEKAYIKTIEN